jgi:hypothetical protein
VSGSFRKTPHREQPHRHDTGGPPTPRRALEGGAQAPVIKDRELGFPDGELTVRDVVLRSFDATPDEVVGRPHVWEVEGLAASHVTVDAPAGAARRLTCHLRHADRRVRAELLVTGDACPVERLHALRSHAGVRIVARRTGHRGRRFEARGERETLDLSHETEVHDGSARHEHRNLPGDRTRAVDGAVDQVDPRVSLEMTPRADVALRAGRKPPEPRDSEPPRLRAASAAHDLCVPGHLAVARTAAERAQRVEGIRAMQMGRETRTRSSRPVERVTGQALTGQRHVEPRRSLVKLER